MPFKSEKQRKFLWAEHPSIAKRWAERYGNKSRPDGLKPEPVEEKKAQVGKVLGYGALAGLGGALGHSVFPKAFDYEDQWGAKNLGGVMDAVSLPALVSGILKHRAGKGGISPGLGGILFAGEQLIPAIKGTLDASRQSAKQMPAAVRDSGLVAQLRGALGSTTGLGAMAGLGVAGAGSLLSSTLRRRDDKEELTGTSRPGMFVKDFTRSAIPLALAGGLAGSLIRQAPPA